MASDAQDDKTRHFHGPRPLAVLVPALVRPCFRGRKALTAQVLADWGGIVGPALAAITTPRRLTAGTLAIACAGPVAMELQHLSDSLISRINGHLGHAAVIRLRFLQDGAPPPAPTLRTPPPPAIAAARAAVAGLPPGGLRDALERLGRAVLTERPA